MKVSVVSRFNSQPNFGVMHLSGQQLKQGMVVAKKVSAGSMGGARKILSQIGDLFKKELPFAKKPLLADANLVHFTPDGMPVEIPLPEIYTAATKILDGSNILHPDAADLAAGAANALTSKIGVIDAVATGTDVLATKTDAVTVFTDVIDALSNLPI